jgi:hypothetical protein
MLSSLVLACQPNSTPIDLPQERSELTSDDTAVIHAAIHSLIIQRYGPYRQYAEKQGQTIGSASIVLVEHTIKVCDVADYDPDWCVPPYYVTPLGRGSLRRLVLDSNQRGLQIREPPGPGVLLGPLEESSPLGGRDWRQRFNLKYPLFSYFGPVWVTVPVYPGADRALIYVQAFVSVIDPPPGGACWVHLRRYRGAWELSPESSNCRIA